MARIRVYSPSGQSLRENEKQLQMEFNMVNEYARPTTYLLDQESKYCL